VVNMTAEQDKVLKVAINE